MMGDYVICSMPNVAINDVTAELSVNTREDENVNPMTIPARACTIVEEKACNHRTTVIALSDEEAALLRNDPRVHSVTLFPSVKPMPMVSEEGNYTRVEDYDEGNVNWGLRRHTVDRPEALSSQTPFHESYGYVHDGTGVDVVIQDDGIQVDHPEFHDINGNSRVAEIDWYAETGIAGSMPPKFYHTTTNEAMRQGGEHGTHVAGIIAGKTYGWAKNAKIYSMRIFGGSQHEIPYLESFDLIRTWHENKPIDPATGVKRPTVVSQSWGFAYFYSNASTPDASIESIVYNGVQVESGGNITRNVQYGMVYDGHPVSVPFVDVEQEQLTDSGAICVHSAGNTYHASSTSGSTGYDSHYTRNDLWSGFVKAGDPIYYNRPMSPVSDDTIVVGSMSNVISSGEETATSISERGGRVELWAAGDAIASCTSDSTLSIHAKSYMGSSDYKMTTLNGSSVAAAQVTGMIVLLVQIHPTIGAAGVRRFFSANSTRTLLGTGTPDNWSEVNSNGSLYGSTGKVPMWPYGSGVGTTVSANISTNIA